MEKHIAPARKRRERGDVVEHYLLSRPCAEVPALRSTGTAPVINPAHSSAPNVYKGGRKKKQRKKKTR